MLLLIAFVAFSLIGFAWFADVLWRTATLSEIFGFVTYWSLVGNRSLHPSLARGLG
jgi:hypothetical protein